MGDLLLALAAPFFHGFETASGFRKSSDRVEGLLTNGSVKRVLSAHHQPSDAESASAAIARTLAFPDDERIATVEVALGGAAFSELWRGVCSRLDKQLEFRGYAMLRCQVSELVRESALVGTGGMIEAA